MWWKQQWGGGESCILLNQENKKKRKKSVAMQHSSFGHYLLKLMQDILVTHTDVMGHYLYGMYKQVEVAHFVRVAIGTHNIFNIFRRHIMGE